MTNVVDAFPERIHSDVPNYISYEGLEDLQAKVRQLETELTDSKHFPIDR